MVYTKLARHSIMLVLHIAIELHTQIHAMPALFISTTYGELHHTLPLIFTWLCRALAGPILAKPTSET